MIPPRARWAIVPASDASTSSGDQNGTARGSLTELSQCVGAGEIRFLGHLHRPLAAFYNNDGNAERFAERGVVGCFEPSRTGSRVGLHEDTTRECLGSLR